MKNSDHISNCGYYHSDPQQQINFGYVTLSYIFAAQVFPRYIKDLKIPAITVPGCFPSSGSPESVMT